MSGDVVVLMPAYNAEATLCDAVLSLFPAKARFDVLVVDDGSATPAETVIDAHAALKPYRSQIHVLRHTPNRGLIATLNAGVQWALERKYRYIVRMDSDDMARPGRIDRQVEFMDAHPDIGVAGTQIKRFQNDFEDLGDSRLPTDHDAIRKHMQMSSGFSHPAMIMRAEAFEKVGPYDPRYLHVEDFDWCWRCIRQFKMANQPEVLLNYRISPNQISAKHRKRQLINKGKVLWREFLKGEIGCLKGLVAVTGVFFMPFSAKIALQQQIERWAARAEAREAARVEKKPGSR